MHSLPLIQVVPPNGNGGSNLIFKINTHKFSFLRKELGSDKIFIVYEDERSVILAGLNGGEPKMVKVSKAWLFSDIKALTSVIPPR